MSAAQKTINHIIIKLRGEKASFLLFPTAIVLYIVYINTNLSCVIINKQTNIISFGYTFRVIIVRLVKYPSIYFIHFAKRNFIFHTSRRLMITLHVDNISLNIDTYKLYYNIRNLFRLFDCFFCRHTEQISFYECYHYYRMTLFLSI